MKTEEKLLGDLCSIISTGSVSVNKITVKLEIKADHPLFAGHFPGNPILPGAATIQIIKELAELQTRRKLILAGAPVIKFISFMNPLVNNMADLTMELNLADDEKTGCTATLSHEGTTFCSFRGEFREMV
ncbi:MAG: hypothetical protein MUE74_09040 [Bacteroidales bacterium]|jgi:3-hydroxyacyl-[acyl-carrier-protein] dehydratase|nr:hypothetical protein [Bacteroidales bacterium]